MEFPAVMFFARLMILGTSLGLTVQYRYINNNNELNVEEEMVKKIETQPDDSSAHKEQNITSDLELHTVIELCLKSLLV